MFLSPFGTAGFGISMFLSPIFASIPPYGTGPAIILVGSLMMEHSRYGEAGSCWCVADAVRWAQSSV